MIFKAIGKVTRKVYVEGKSKAEIFRKLQKKYPYEIDTPNEYKKVRSVRKLYPEELLIIKED